MKRTEIRELTFKLIYSLEIQKNENLDEQIELYIENNNIEEQDAIEYIKDCIYGINKNEEEIKKIVEDSLTSDWKIDRISKVNLSLLKLAIYEIKYKNIPYKVEINEVVENSVSDMFAKTEFFGYAKGGRPVYISEKCKDFWWGDREPSDASKTLVKDKRDSRTPGWSKMDSMITALFVDDYGVERAAKLFQFLSDFNITDLHSHNVMISEKTGKIVITDYSGFGN